MPRLAITCITKPDRDSTHDRIQRVGGVGFNYSLAEACDLALNQGYQFYVHGQSLLAPEVNVYVVQPAGFAPFLQTHADGQWTNNLLALPECDTGILSGGLGALFNR